MGWRATDLAEDEAPQQAPDLNVTFNQYGQRNEDERRRVEPPIGMESATWSAAGKLDWWVKERQEWWGRVRRPDGRQEWIKAADLRSAKKADSCVTAAARRRHLEPLDLRNNAP
jgi:hypothetical protein